MNGSAAALSTAVAPAWLEVPAVDLALGLAVLIAAAASLISRSRLAQAMGFLALGALITLVWLRLESVDVSLAEAGVGGGILGALLVWLAIRSPESVPPDAAAEPRRGLAGDRRGRVPGPEDPTPAPTEPDHSRRGLLRRALRPGLGLLCGAALSVVLASVWLRVEQTLPAWEEPVEEAMPGTGLEHEVTGVLLAFRAYDTLLESAVVMLAATAAMALGRDGGLHQAFIRQPPVPSTLRWLVQVAAPVLLLAACWLLFAGSSDSGGAFQSGAVLCALMILLRTAHASARDVIPEAQRRIRRVQRIQRIPGVPGARLTVRWLRPVLVAGVITFILAGLLGPLLASPLLSVPWLAWDPSWAFAAILTVEVLLTAGIAAGLYAIYLALENPQGVQ